MMFIRYENTLYSGTALNLLQTFVRGCSYFKTEKDTITGMFNLINDSMCGSDRDVEQGVFV